MDRVILKRFVWPVVALVALLVIGTVGYRLIAGPDCALVDAFYMTMITITTIGFGEVIEVAVLPGGRLFTIFIAVAGIGVLFYIITNFTALLVEGEVTKSFRRRKMERKVKDYKDHYIICGVGELGVHIANELSATKRPYVIVEVDKSKIDRLLDGDKNRVFIEGDATDNTTLLKAGIGQARGLFATLRDDNHNLVVVLTARQLNPGIRVVSRCSELRNSDKMKKAGADAVISPGFIGGLRMASEMVRPAVVSFLDTMLRDREENLRVEEVDVPAAYSGQTIASLKLKKYPKILLLAVKVKADWTYNPPDDAVLQPESTLVFMGRPEDRSALEKDLQNVA
jgi:voltage-gated potassium channel